MGGELIAIIITGVVSGLDVIINMVGFCMTGRCKSDCCGMTMEHDEECKTPRITESQMEDIKKTISK